jgi:hypothetical protein
MNDLIPNVGAALLERTLLADERAFRIGAIQTACAVTATSHSTKNSAAAPQ